MDINKIEEIKEILKDKGEMCMKKTLIIIAGVAALVYFGRDYIEKKRAELPEDSRHIVTDTLEAEPGETDSFTTVVMPLTTADSTGMTDVVTTVTFSISDDPDNLYYVRGNIVDRNGVVIAASSDGVRCINPIYSEALSNLVDGYNSETALDSVFESILRSPNPTRIPVDNDTLTGESIQLTIDGAASDTIYKYFKDNSITGSATVISDGEIIAAVSYPSYDSNNDEEIYNIREDQKVNLCFVPENTGEMNDIFADCASKYKFNSSEEEVFFRLGAENTASVLDELFSFSRVETDFTELRNTININKSEDLKNITKGTAFKCSPLYTAMITDAAANGGTIKKPHILSRVLDTETGRVISPGSETETVRILPAEFLKDIQAEMENEAMALGISSAYVKSGRALTDNGNNIQYISGTIKDAHGRNVTIVFQHINPSNYAEDSKHFRFIADQMKG